MKKLRTNKLRLSAGISLAASLLCCLTLGLTGIFGGFAKKAEAKVAATPILLNTSNGQFDTSDLSSLFQKISGNKATSYETLVDWYSTSNKEKSATDLGAISVELGGKTWNVVYLSKATADGTAANNGAGDIDDLVLTLWRADYEGETSKWGNFYNYNDTSATYPTGLYGSSYIRAYLNGGFYATDNSNAEYMDANASWSTFTSQYADYLCTPAQLNWQLNQKCGVNNGWTIDFPNNAGIDNGAPTGSRFDYRGKTGANYIKTKDGKAYNIGYYSWINDKVWLPSFLETGIISTSATSTDGIWVKTTKDKNASTILSSATSNYMRSASYDYTPYIGRLDQNGSDSGGSSASNPLGIRPAIHLNLKLAAGYSANIKKDLYNSDTKELDDEALSNLYSKIAGKENATVADVKKLLNKDNGFQYSASDIRTGGTDGGTNAVTNGGDIYVYFGGLRWTVTYVSKSKTGNLVATLWLDSSYINGTNYTAQYSTWNTANANWSNTYCSAIYGTSYIRSYLNGTPYYTSTAGAMNTTGAANAYWKTFRESYGKFIIEPLYMGWQETESQAAVTASKNFPNEAWGNPSTGEWCNAESSTLNNQLGTQKAAHSAWATDKLWAPSQTEVGLSVNINTDASLWEVSTAQRRNGTSTQTTLSTEATWLRTPCNKSAAQAVALFGDGVGANYQINTNSTYSVRPAIHLNISGDATDLFDTDKKATNDFELDVLMQNLTSATSNKATISSSYKDLDELLSATSKGVMTSADIRANNDGSDINVKFGGMHWDLTYLSRTRTGDIIATLWLDNSNELINWAPFEGTTTASAYPMNMYSSSYGRAYLNGTPYTTNGTTLGGDGKAAQSAKWKKFIADYSSYIATPSQVAWQENISAAALNMGYSGDAYNHNGPNEAYGKPTQGAFNTGMDYLTSNPKNGYTDWQYDYLWYPAFAETGHDNGHPGLFECSQAQRSNTYASWIRTGHTGNAAASCAIAASGAENSNISPHKTTALYAVRPAFHLNLTRIKDLLTPVISDNAATEDGANNKLTYNGEAQEVINNILTDLSKVSYVVEYTSFASTDTKYYYPNALADGIEVENGTMFARLAGKYKVTFTLENAATTTGSSNYTIEKGEDGWNRGDVWAGIDDDIKTGNNERVSTIVICFEISPVKLEVEWTGDLTATYDGDEHTVTATPKGSIVSGETVTLTVTYSGGANPTNAGEYVATATLTDSNYILAYKDADGFDTKGYAATCTIKINKKTIAAEWTTATEFTYDGSEQGAEITSLTGLCDDSATNIALLEAAQGAVTYDKDPVHVGNYVASVSLEGLDGFENYELSKTGAEFKFKIIPAEITASYASEEADGKFVREFNGTKLEVTADGFTTLATGDDESIFVIKYKLASAEDKPENWSETAPVFGEYVAKAFDNADGDYKVTNAQTINITKRQIELVWSGDEKSVITNHLGVNYFTWLYDGDVHAPTAAVKEGELDGVVDLNGNPVTDLKLTVNLAGQSGASVTVLTTRVRLSADDDFNKYFALAGATNDNAACQYRIIKLTIDEVQWYAHGDFGGTALADDVLFQKIEVFGKDGPEVEAYGVGTLDGVDAEGNAKTVTSTIKLAVAYNANYANAYWPVGNYTATANVSVGTSNADFASGLDKILDFKVSEQKIDVKEVTVVWGLLVNGKFVELTDKLVVPFTGKAPELRAKADSATGSDLPVNAGSLSADAGKHTAYVDLKNSSTVVYKNFECAYEITPLKVKLTWAGNTSPDLLGKYEWYYTGSDIALSATIDTTYLDDRFTAAEYAGVLTDVASMATVTVKSAKNAGKHTAVAEMSKNFEIVDGSDTLEFTVLKYRLDISKVVWWSKAVDGVGTDDDSRKFDSDMTKYFTWANNGKSHAPYAELSVTIGGVNTPIKLVVSGATGTTGTHYATALLDSSDPANNNFILGRFETTDDGTEFVPCGAECKFIIVQFEVGDIYWVTGANEGADVSLNGTDKLYFTYNGKAQAPRAYYLDGEDKVWLEVWGEMTDAGEYVAHVSENFAFTNEDSDKCTFVIKAQELEVRWQLGDKITYNGQAQAPTVKLFDSTGKEITTLSDGNGYEILKFTEAGEHVAKISFTNGNYTFKAGTDEKAFTIAKRKINVTFTRSSELSYVWKYNAEEQGPAFKDTTIYLVDGGDAITFGESSEHRIIVSGRETDVGKYTVKAALDSSVADNANFELVDAEKDYEIAAYEITIIWKDEGSNGKFTWTYSGKTVHPTATYQDWTGTTQEAKVTGGNASAGTYTASVVLPANCKFRFADGEEYSGTHEFTIKPATVADIEWYLDDTYETKIEGPVAIYDYDGKLHLPAAKIKSTGANLIVTGARRNAGEGYVATAALSDAGNYVLDETNANKTIKFNIKPMNVFIEWIGNEDADGEFVWTYTGEFFCPTAKLVVWVDGEKQVVTENGKDVYVTVSGGAVAAGNEHVAVATDNLGNYDFATERQHFTILPKTVTGFEWNAAGAKVDDSAVADGGYVKYSYTYNGKTQRPLASLKNNTLGLKFGYTIEKFDGENYQAVADTVNAGLYRVTVYTIDGNYALPESNATIMVEIGQRTAEVKWDAPEAWFFDADNQAVKLDVKIDPDGFELGEDGKTVTLKFIASVSPEDDNYNFTGEKTKEFTKVVTDAGDLEWDFENEKWITPPVVTPPTEGGETGGETEGETGGETGGTEGGEGSEGGETGGESGSESGSEGDGGETGGYGTETTALVAETSVKTVENRAIAADNQQLIADDKKSATLFDEE